MYILVELKLKLEVGFIIIEKNVIKIKGFIKLM